jgi:uncharacterized protein YeaO (DUF488 family)
MIRTKRVYNSAKRSDGTRFLVDHLWPRGLKKEAVQVEQWIKEVSPSNDLRNWFGHEPAKWKGFQSRYFAELDEKPETWKTLLEAARVKDVTLVFSAHDTEHNNAVALQKYLERKLVGESRGRRLRRAIERWENEGGQIPVKGKEVQGSIQGAAQRKAPARRERSPALAQKKSGLTRNR